MSALGTWWASGLRPKLQVGGAALAALVAIAAAVLIVRQRTAPQLTGGVFSDSPAAPNFTLNDQNNQPVSMAALRGKVVALTFLYTHCQDVCPTIATNMSIADRKLGSSASAARFVAVSVDPVGDTLPNVRAFTREHGLAGDVNWHYLVGSPAELRPVWSAYHISAGSNSASPQSLDHSALVYLVDPHGKLRVILSANFAVADLVHDVSALAAGA
ncbi:MAG: SCO family protein [Chloroflexota bacterium]